MQSDADAMNMSVEDIFKRQELKLLLQYSMIVVSAVPVMILYPFIQKYFVKGIMMGSIKG